MWLSQWLEWLRGRRRPRSRAIVSFDAQAVSCRWPGGAVESVRWADLRVVEVRTTDTGPFLEDVFLVLRSAEGDCVIPQEAENFSALLGRCQQLPGFDNNAVISAMSCTENAVFLCWQRQHGKLNEEVCGS